MKVLFIQKHLRTLICEAISSLKKFTLSVISRIFLKKLTSEATLYLTQPTLNLHIMASITLKKPRKFSGKLSKAATS